MKSNDGRSVYCYEYEKDVFVLVDKATSIADPFVVHIMPGMSKTDAQDASFEEKLLSIFSGENSKWIIFTENCTHPF